MNNLFKGLSPQNIGTHKFTFLAALRCREHGLTQEQAEEMIDTQENNMPRYFKDGEVTEAVANAYNSTPRKGGSRQCFPDPDAALRAKIIAQYAGFTVEKLMAASVELPDLPTIEILRTLFPNDPLLCVGESKERFRTRRLSAYRVAPALLSQAQFITPSPMKSQWGETKNGTLSQHCESNTGPRRFLIVEIDDALVTKDQQSGIICHLAEMAPLAAVVDSRNRSLHAWFFVSGQSEARDSRLRQFFDYACRLGADPALWRLFQFVRMPNGMRKDDKGNNVAKQSLLYFNPHARQGGKIAGHQLEGLANV
jgi:hypothetical protein